jgi:hypothetical protein
MRPTERGGGEREREREEREKERKRVKAAAPNQREHRHTLKYSTKDGKIRDGWLDGRMGDN